MVTPQTTTALIQATFTAFANTTKQETVGYVKKAVETVATTATETATNDFPIKGVAWAAGMLVFGMALFGIYACCNIDKKKALSMQGTGNTYGTGGSN